MKIPGLQALARDRFFHLLLLIGAGLSLFVPFAPQAWPAATAAAEPPEEPPGTRARSQGLRVAL